MEKLNKATEEICKDCEYGVIIQNCRECLFNIFRQNFTSEENKDVR